MEPPLPFELPSIRRKSSAMIAPGSMQRREGADGDRLLSYIEVAETADTAKERGRSVL
jgi:hypothetical protein